MTSKSTLFISARAAASSWWTLFGVIAASITAFSLLQKLIRIGLAKVMSDLLAAYRSFVHLPVRWLFDWIHIPDPPAWAIDFGVLWMLLGGVVLRSAWAVRIATIGTRKATLYFGSSIDALFEKRTLLLPFLIYTLIAWPHVTYLLLQRPHMHEDIGIGQYSGSVWAEPARSPNFTMRYLFDMRVVLAVQAITAVACVVLWLVLNVLLKMYE